MKGVLTICKYWIASILLYLPRLIAERPFARFPIFVVIMAFAYFCLWEYRPDFFRVESDVNVRPIDFFLAARSDLESIGINVSSTPGAVASEDGGAKLVSLYGQLQAKLSLIRAKRQEFATSEERLKQISELLSEEQGTEIERYLSYQLRAFDAQLEQFDKDKQLILERSNVKSLDDLANGDRSQYAQIEEKQAQVRLARSEAKARALEYAAEYPAEFQRSSIRKFFSEAQEHSHLLNEEISNIENQRDELNGQIYDSYVAYVASEHSKLGMYDFLYFSIGVSTAVTFGDIAPNHGLVRLLVSLQVFVSIFAIGNIVEMSVKPLTILGRG